METKHVDIERIKKDMDHINSITATPGQGSTRLSYSKEDDKVRDYIKKELERIGADISVDGMGNIRAKINQKEDLPSIMVGSHIDTVPNGGRFDGLTGTICALEVLRQVYERNVETKYPVELIIFAEEEGSNFGVTTLGSQVICGIEGPDILKRLTNDSGVTAYDYLKEKGLEVDKIKDQIIEPDEIRAMIELHVEQGGVLDQKGIGIGIVEAIAGMNTFSVRLEGQSNHAGSTPMNMRQDPLAGAAEIILAMEDFAKNKAGEHTVATVGKLKCYPCASNVINGYVEFNVDIRDVDPDWIEKTSDFLVQALEEVAIKRELEVECKHIGQSAPQGLSKNVVGTLKAKADELGLENIQMHSGAVHDSMMLNELTDVGMIFVPSKEGISHSPDEDTSFDDIEKGAELLYQAVIDLANN